MKNGSLVQADAGIDVPRSTPYRRVRRQLGKAAIKAVFGLFPERVVARRDGIVYRLDLRDDLQQLVFLNLYERAELRRLRRFIRPGSCCIDAGANVGVFTIHMAKLAGPSGRVIAFEPDPQNAECLIENAALNACGEMVKVEPSALSSEPGTMTFYKSSSGHSAWGSLVRYRDLATQELAVTVDSVDAYCARHGIRRIDFLKIDVEGAEFELLQGSRNALRDGAVRNVMIEFNGPRLAQRRRSLSEMLQYFHSFGYALLYRSRESASVARDERRSELLLENLWFGLRSDL